MKKLLLLPLVLLLGACSPTIEVDSNDWKLPYELRDCQVIEMTKGTLSSVKAVLIKCPEGYLGSSTTVSDDDSSSTVSTIFQ